MFSNPKVNIEEFKLEKGMKVADLGVGSGFYSFEAAKVVGEEGRVYAVDIQKDLLDYVKKEAEVLGIKNIDVVLADLETEKGTKFKDASLDAVVASNILFQIKDKDVFMKEVYRILKEGGKVLAIDWSDSWAGIGPKRGEVFFEMDAKKLFVDTGFQVESVVDAGDHHWGFVLKK